MNYVSNSTRLPPGNLGGLEGAKFFRGPVEFLWERYHRHGRIFKTDLGGPLVFLIGPEAHRFMLHGHREYFNWGKSGPKYLEAMFGDEPMAMKDGEEYRRLKAIVAPTVAANKLTEFFPFMQAALDRQISKWARNGEICFYTEVRELIHEVGAMWLVGPDRDFKDMNTFQALWHTFTDVPEGRRDLPRAPDVPRRSRGDFVTELRARATARRQLEDHLGQVIAARKEHPGTDAISIMCHEFDKRTNTQLTDDEIVGQAMMMLSGGNDTTSSMATWLVLELARYPNVVQKLREEIDARLSDKALTHEHLKQLPYLQCVLREVERVHSPTLGGVRVAASTFQFDGYTVPEGWRVRNCAAVSHFLPEIFEDPDVFDPDRFAPPREEDKRTPYALIGFGEGPRQCTGKHFALQFLSILAVTVARYYHVTVTPGQDLLPVLDRVFKPKSRLLCRFRLRELPA